MVKLRYLAPGSELTCNSLAAEMLGHRAHKDIILKRLGIERQEGEMHLDAWMRVMAEENGVDVAAVGEAIREVALFDAALVRFIWVLA